MRTAATLQPVSTAVETAGDVGFRPVLLDPATRPARRGGHPVRPGPRAPRDADLLARLRATGTARGRVDASLVGGLRAWLEDAAAPSGDRPSPVLWTAPRAETTFGDARAAIARTVFRLVVTGAAPANPMEEALAALSVTPSGPRVVEVVRRMGARDRDALRATSRADARSIALQWRRPPHAWLPRTAERLRVPLAGGALELRATADLVLGAPSDGTASVCLVEVDAGAPGAGPGRSRRRLALLETLRSGAPPFRVATYHPRPGLLVADDVTEEVLVSAVVDVVGALSGRTR